MKLKSLVFAIVSAASLGAVFAAESVPLHFNAVLTDGKEKRFGVSIEGGAHSSWLTLGEKFEGYTLKDFDDAAQTLVVEKDGKAERLALASSHITTATTKASLADAEAVMKKMHFEEMIGKMIDGQKDMSASMVKKMVAQMGGKTMTQEQMDSLAAFQTKVMQVMWSEMKPEDLKTDVTKIYSELFTKEELQGLSDFYSTPAGEALTSKQAELQQRTSEAMMPRLMSAMPKIQEMAKEFAQSQAANKAAATQATTAAAAAATPPAATPAAPASGK